MTESINQESSLKAYFHAALEKAAEHNHLSTTEHTIWYLTNLLHSYSRSDTFFDYQKDSGTLTPLAAYYHRAMEANSVKERRLHLQRLGDVAMFISGMFSAALEKRIVGKTYYVSMGEAAYGTLAQTAGASSKDRSQAAIFKDLSAHFPAFVKVLNSISEPGVEEDPHLNLLNQFDEWQQSKDPTLAQKLRDAGVLLPCFDEKVDDSIH